ncbi:hypothetical protein, partial [Actinoplanes utahensis]
RRLSLVDVTRFANHVSDVGCRHLLVAVGGCCGSFRCGEVAVAGGMLVGLRQGVRHVVVDLGAELGGA